MVVSLNWPAKWLQESFPLRPVTHLTIGLGRAYISGNQTR